MNEHRIKSTVIGIKSLLKDLHSPKNIKIPFLFYQNIDPMKKQGQTVHIQLRYTKRPKCNQAIKDRK